MTPIAELKSRFLQDSRPRRLGAIASDLARLAGIYSSPRASKKLRDGVLTEIKLFTEWIAPDTDLKTQAQIAQLQKSLLVWQGANGPVSEVRQWSARCLQMSGLLGGGTLKP